MIDFKQWMGCLDCRRLYRVVSPDSASGIQIELNILRGEKEGQSQQQEWHKQRHETYYSDKGTVREITLVQSLHWLILVKS